MMESTQSSNESIKNSSNKNSTKLTLDELDKSYKNLLKQIFYRNLIVTLLINKVQFVKCVGEHQYLFEYPNDTSQLIQRFLAKLSQNPLTEWQDKILYQFFIDCGIKHFRSIIWVLGHSKNSQLADLLKIVLYRATKQNGDKNGRIITENLKAVLESSCIQTANDQDVLNVQPTSLDLLNAAANHDRGHLADLLKFSLDKVCWVDRSTSQNPFHFAVTRDDSTKAILFLQDLKTQLDTDERVRLQAHKEIPGGNTEDFLVWPDFGNTPLHTGAQRGSLDIIQFLYNLAPHVIHYQNKCDVTPLMTMYEKRLDFVLSLLDRAGYLETHSAYLSDGETIVTLDFTNLIGVIVDQKEKRWQRNSVETLLLAGNVFGDRKHSLKLILAHPVVRIFLDLKWNKMRLWIYFMSLINMFLFVIYIFFAIQIFIIAHPNQFTSPDIQSNKTYSCQSELSTSVSGIHYVNTTIQIQHHNFCTKNQQSNRTFSQYLFGTFGKEGMDVFDDYESFVSCISFSLLYFLIILTHEIFITIQIQATIYSSKGKSNVTSHSKQNSGQDQGVSLFDKMLINLKIFWSGLFTYFSDFENCLQILYMILLMIVSQCDFEKEAIQEMYYITATLSILVAWTLILIQFGNISRHVGIYVQMLKTVLLRFFKLMSMYASLLLAFGISFGLLFYQVQDGIFETLPLSLSRVFPMMGGEFNWDEIFIEDRPGSSKKDSLIPLARHLLHLTFNIVVTIVFFNLLVGQTVGDIQEIQAKADVVHREIQVTRLYIMENILLNIRKFFCSLAQPTPMTNQVAFGHQEGNSSGSGTGTVQNPQNVLNTMATSSYSQSFRSRCGRLWHRFLSEIENWTTFKVIADESFNLEISIPLDQIKDLELQQEIENLFSSTSNNEANTQSSMTDSIEETRC